MDIRGLRTFIAIAQAGNITRAAEELHISQPALSRQIIKMENELGCKLLERGGHGISLTNAGHLLLNRARELSDLLDKTEAELKAPDVASGEVSIACSETRATLAIAHVAKRLELTHPGIRFKFRSESSDDVTEHLSRGIVDFGIAVGPARTDDYHALKLPDTDRWGALVPADDDLAAAASLGPQDLIDRPLIMPEKILAQQRICDWMGCDLTRLDVRATYNLLYTASLLVRAHVGAALCLDGIVAPSPENGLAFIPLAPLAHIACRAHLEPQPPTLARGAGVFRRRRSVSGRRSGASATMTATYTPPSPDGGSARALTCRHRRTQEGGRRVGARLVFSPS